MAAFVKHDSCPRCGSRDNLAVYDDGSEFCFGCHKWTAPNTLSYIRSAINKLDTKQEEHIELAMPDDVEPTYPLEAVEWFKKCELGISDMRAMRCLWSERKKWLIFPIFDDRHVISWQARSFNPEEKRKYISQGNIHNVVNIYGSGSPLYLTEGILDSYKIYRYTGNAAMPVFGSHISTRMALRLLTLGHEHYVIWLDADKYKEAVSFQQMLLTCGASSVRVIYNKEDPKNANVKEVIGD